MPSDIVKAYLEIFPEEESRLKLLQQQLAAQETLTLVAELPGYARLDGTPGWISRTLLRCVNKLHNYQLID